MNTINKLIKLSGRRALITGASGGLGRAISETLAELGADLILTDREGTNLEEIRNSLMEKWSIQVEWRACNLECQTARSELITEYSSCKRGLNILVNNAALAGTAELTGWAVPFEEQTVETWRRALEVNLTAVFDLSKGFSSTLKNEPGGAIINIASIYGLYGPDWSLYADTNMSNPAAYGASKGGLIQFTHWLSTTLAPLVRVNAISPGGIYRGQPDVFVERYSSRTPLKRMATEDDFRGAIAYLASDLSRYVTGQNLVVDGGWGV
jgi:NAD(P)-dependent dehydrogenase (short-subunit alcohol dehydrogenase family)